MSYWQGKRAVVTGGTTGLGRAVAIRLAEKGARVAVVARGQQKITETLDELKQFQGEAIGIAGDVTNQCDVDNVASTVLSAWGGVDLLCHCAGRSMRGKALETPPEVYRDMWEVNFLSAVRCVQALAPPLIENRGHVVLIGSLASKVAAKYLGGYPAAKFSLAAFAQQLRLECSELGLHTLLVCPGPIAREDAPAKGGRYAEQVSGLPSAAQAPGGGAKIRAIDPHWLAERILTACERRRAELIVPARARLLFAIAQLNPQLGDWLLRRMTSG